MHLLYFILLCVLCLGVSELMKNPVKTHFLFLVLTCCVLLVGSLLVSCNKHEHIYSDWVVVKEATCTEQGLRQKVCTECGESFSEIIDALGHNSDVTDDAVAPTCTKTGLTEGKHCSRCGEITVPQQTVDATGHKEVIIPAIEATCTSNAKSSGKRCSVCGIVLETQEIIPDTRLPHSYDEDSICTVCHYHNWTKDLSFSYIGSNSCAVNGIGMSKSTDIVIPLTYNNYPVTQISKNAFNKSSITSVLITSNVNTIESYAFSECNSLISVTIGKNVKTINNLAFSNCANLKSVYYTGSIAEWCSIEGVYNLMKGDVRLYIGGVQITGDLVIPNGVTTIPSCAFHNCLDITSVKFPNSLIEIGYGAFENCNNLTSIVIPNGVETISDYAFYNCTNLEYLTFDENSQIFSIGSCAFKNCSSLMSINFPSSLKNIYFNSFDNCSCLTTVKVGKAATSIPSFNGCHLLELIVVDDSNSVYSSQNGILYNKEKTNIIIVPQNIQGDVIIPAGVTIINKETFYNRDKLVSVRFEDNSALIRICDSAFRGCTNLTQISLPSGVTTIEHNVFMDCKSLKALTIPNSVTSIENGAFSGSGIESIMMPNSITSIEYNTFYECHNLLSIAIPDSVEQIGGNAFRSCHSLTTVIIPNSVTTIESGAFEGCNSLQLITLPNSIVDICDDAFRGCTKLESITVDNNNPNYSSQDGILYNKNKNRIIHVPQAIQGEVVIPSGIISISDSLFSWCDGLTIVTLTNGITSIETQAFALCSSLKSIYIPQSVVSFGASVFYGCGELTLIEFEGTIDQWNQIEKTESWDNGMKTCTISCSNGTIIK